MSIKIENITFWNEQKSIFENKMTKVALGLRTWFAAYVRELKHVYASTFLHTQQGFQKQMKGKFSAIIAKVWNESHVV